MKRKYAAIVLGLTMTLTTANISAVNIMAATASTAQEKQTKSEDSDSSQSEKENKSDSDNPEDGNEKQSEGEASDGEKPEGEAPDGEKPEGEAPDGEKPDGEPPEKPEGQEPNGGQGAPGGAPGEQSNGVESYEAVNDYTEDVTVENETVSFTRTDENAIHVSEGASAILKGLTVNRESEDSKGGDTSSFYGVGAAILATEGTAYVGQSSITTDAAGAAGIFAYGDGTVYTADTDITTQKDTAGGIHAAGGGTLYAWDMNVETNGESAAAIRSDRGGGKMVVDGGTYTSNGVGSPAIYSTADIAVNNAVLTANGSEAICIEGLNSIHLFDSDLTGNMSDLEQNDCTWNVILYQSMSGDSQVGNSTFEMNGGSLTAKNGGMFYTTNTESTITLSDVDITNAEDSESFLKCTGNANERGWGTAGDNGADCLFTAVQQEMEGDVVWDSISQLDFYITDGSTLTGAVTDDETNAGDGGEGYCNVYVGEDCTWTVTGDSVLTGLSNSGTIVDEDGNTVTVKGSDGTVYVEGTGSYTVTVESYSDSADLSGSSEVTQWSDYQVEKPEALA